MPDLSQVRIKPILAFLCDDVRKEDNGKPFILGIYTAGITMNRLLPNQLPAAKNEEMKPYFLTSALWMAYEATGSGKAEVEFEIVAPNPKRKLAIKAGVELIKAPPSHEILTLSFGGLMIPIEREGDIKILFRNMGDEAWETLRIIPVTINPEDSSLTASVPHEPTL